MGFEGRDLKRTAEYLCLHTCKIYLLYTCFKVYVDMIDIIIRILEAIIKPSDATNSWAQAASLAAASLLSVAPRQDLESGRNEKVN